MAIITRPHGLKGDVALDLRTDIPHERLEPGVQMSTNDGRTLTVRRGWQHSGKWLVAFEEVADRSGAEDLRGLELRVNAPESDEEDAWYAHELAGLEARLPSGEVVGEVKGLEYLPAQDALVIKEPSGARSLVPLVTEIVPEVSIDGGYVVIDPPAGLLADLPSPEGDETD